MIHLITYGDDKFKEGKKRIFNQANNTGWFDNVTLSLINSCTFFGVMIVAFIIVICLVLLIGFVIRYKDRNLKRIKNHLTNF